MNLCQPFWVPRFQSPRKETDGLSTKSGGLVVSCLTVPPNCIQLERNWSPNVNWGAITKTTKMVKGERGAFLMRLVRITHSLIYVRRVSYLSYLYLRLSTLWLNQCCLRSFSPPPLAYSPEGSGHSSCIIWKMVSWRSPVLYFKINKEILWVNLGKSKCIFLHSTIENFYKFLKSVKNFFHISNVKNIQNEYSKT